MNDTTPKTLYLQRVQATNYAVLRLFTAEPNGEHMTVGGANGSGKTTALRAVAVLLGGKSYEIGRPLRDGEKDGELLGTLQDADGEPRYHIRRKVDEKGIGGLKITLPDGTPLASRESVLSGFLSDVALDPAGWLERAKSGQRAQRDRAEKECRDALGINIDDLDARHNAAYAKRHEIGLDVKRLKGVVDSLTVYADTPDELEDVAALATRLDEATGANRKNEDVRRELSGLIESLAGRDTSIAQAEEDAGGLTSQVEVLSTRIGELDGAAEALTEKEAERTKLVEALGAITLDIDACRDRVQWLDRANEDMSATRAELAGVSSTLDGHREERVKLSAAVDAAKAEVNGLKDIDTAPIRERIDGAEAINEKVRSNIEHAERTAELAERETGYQAETYKIGRVAEERTERIAASDCSIPGLDFGDDGILLNGHALGDGTSTEEEMRLALNVAMAQKPDARIVLVPRAESLDDSSLAELKIEAKEQGVQLIIEDCSAQHREPAAIIIEGGMVRAEKPAKKSRNAKKTKSAQA